MSLHDHDYDVCLKLDLRIAVNVKCKTTDDALHKFNSNNRAQICHALVMIAIFVSLSSLVICSVTRLISGGWFTTA